MKAIVLHKGGPPEVLQFEDLDLPEPGPGEARVRLRAAGLNHRDIWRRKSYAEAAPVIPGSDGAGVVDAVGSPRDSAWVGREVVIYPGFGWGHREEAPERGFEILGIPSPGTYAEAIVVPVANLVPKPEHMTAMQVASIPVAGLTAWRALFTQGRLMPGQTVLLPGIGSGVAGFALAFAKGAGARVIATSSSDDKLRLAREQGADLVFNYRDEAWESQVKEAVGADGIDLAIDHAGARSIPACLRLVRFGGRVVYLGLTTGETIELNLRPPMWKQAHLIGTLMGSPREFEQMLQWMRVQRYVPEIRHVFPLAEAAKAHAFMEAGKQFGKIMLHI
ncbi:MAG: zinc-binding dehydrogenase [Candidatus Lambdaproteobacteria bacterium]|nr:zinc-binding dehydrogenase [Candidatus Lambdaproteobacteria bacterium]